MLKDMEENMIKSKKNLKTTQYRKKSYADKGKTFKEFKVGKHVFLKVRANKSSLKLGSCKKLVARYCGPFEILKRIRPITYEIALPSNIESLNVFHVSLLKKYIHDPNYIIVWNVIQVEPEGDFYV